MSRRCVYQPHPFRMHDTAAGDHPVDRARSNRLHGAEAVAVNDLAVKQVGDRGESDVRVWAHVQATTGAQYRRAHLIEEYKRPDHAALSAGQGAAHVKAIAKIVHRRDDDEFDARADAGLAVINRFSVCDEALSAYCSAAADLTIEPSAAAAGAYCPAAPVVPVPAPRRTRALGSPRLQS